MEDMGGAIMTTVSQLIPFLAQGYEEKCIELGVIQRQRGIKTPADLMMLSLFHLNNGCSLLEISEVARLLKIGEFSDVAFMKKFGKCAEWFKWISEQLAPGIVADYKKPAFLDHFRVVAFDASDVIEKGRSGQRYHLHYGIDIFKMCSVDYKITKEEIGEKLSNFSLVKGDLAIADRAYGTINGIEYCVESEADYILRLRTNCFKIYDANEEAIDFFTQFHDLDFEQCTDFSGFVRTKTGKRIPVRICVKHKSKEACEKSRKRLRRRESKSGNKLSEKTVRFNEYIVLATSLPSSISSEDVLETYRYRWQVEIFFKRLKSILNFGDLPKKRENSSLAWLNGKLMVALLIELFLSTSTFSPSRDNPPEYLERNEID
jgi:hypothetical protein